MKLLSTLAVACLAAQAAGAAISHKLNGFTIYEHPDPAKRALLQQHVCVLLAGDSRVLTEGLGHLGRALAIHQWRKTDALQW